MRLRHNNLIPAVILVLLIVIGTVFPLQAERIVTETSIAPGCRHIKIIDPDKQLGIYVLKTDLRNDSIKVFPVIGQDAFPGRETIRFMSLRYDQKDLRFHVDSINRFHDQGTITLYTDIHGERTRVRSSGREILLNPHGRLLISRQTSQEFGPFPAACLSCPFHQIKTNK